MLVKCQQCGLKDTDRKDMIKEKKGYYHPSCHELYLEQEEARKQELIDWDELYQTIKDIYDIEVVPKVFIQRLQELRNGTYVAKGAGKVTKYKQGVKYNIIRRAYELSREKIRWYHSNKQFKSDVAELNYGFMIVLEKINEAYAKAKAKRQADVKAEATAKLEVDALVEESEQIDTPKQSPQIKKPKIDLSDLLD